MNAAINPGVYMQPSRKGILCLCHDETVLHLRHMMLEHFGYKVWSTSSVEDAKTIAHDRCPDMLLIDHTYPDTERVAEQLKRSCPELIAVVLSPYFAVRQVSHSAVDNFVPRDEGPDAMVERIEEIFQVQATKPHGRRGADGGTAR